MLIMRSFDEESLIGNSGRDTAVRSRKLYMDFFAVCRQALKYARIGTMTRENGDSETTLAVFERANIS